MRRRRMWLSPMAAALLGAGLIAAAFASPAASEPSGQSSSERRGGTIRINVTGTDIDHIDPQLAYGTTSWSMEYSTALKLVNFPDCAAPCGSRLRPEGARSFSVSRNGRVYTFNIRSGFRFSNGTPVTARHYRQALLRSANRSLQSPGYQFISDPNGANIIGITRVREAGASSAAGIQIRGSRLIIRLAKPDATFLAKIAMPFFQATHTSLPLGREVISVSGQQLPSAGPYYVAFREPNRSVQLRRNPQWGRRTGAARRYSRPQMANVLDFRMNVNLEAGYRQVLAGEVEQSAVPPANVAETARRFGVNRRNGRFRVEPVNCTRYLAANHNKPLFRNNAPLKRAVSFVIHRPQMNQQYGPFAGSTHDQILPKGFPGFRNASLYPLGRPNVARARQLARGRTRGGEVVLFYGLTGVGPQLMESVRNQLQQIGLRTDPRGYRGFAIYDAAGTRGSAHDLVFAGWCQDYPDPYDFINVLLYGGNIQAQNNNNLAYFNHPTFNRRMERASRLLGAARLRAYGQLDIDIQRQQAPWASWQVINDRLLFGPRVQMSSYAFQPVYENTIYNRLALR